MGTKATSGFFKGTKGNPVAGDANFMNSNDGFLKYIRIDVAAANAHAVWVDGQE